MTKAKVNTLLALNNNLKKYSGIHIDEELVAGDPTNELVQRMTTNEESDHGVPLAMDNTMDIQYLRNAVETLRLKVDDSIDFDGTCTWINFTPPSIGEDPSLRERASALHKGSDYFFDGWKSISTKVDERVRFFQTVGGTAPEDAIKGDTWLRTDTMKYAVAWDDAGTLAWLDLN